MRDPTKPFGAELRRARLAAGLSLAELAGVVHYSKGYLSKIETGRKAAGVDLARRCDAALGTGGALAALVEPAPPPPAGAPGHPAADEVWTMQLSPLGESWFAPVDRGDAPLALGLTHPGWSAANRHDAAYELFAAMFELHRRSGRTMPPAAVLPAVIAQTHTLRELAAAAAPPARDKLLWLAARYAEFTGWMAQESGQDRAATWWTRSAVEMATTAGDRDLAAHGLVRTALVAMLREDAGQTVALAGRAQADASVSPRIRGLAALREAQGHALAGDEVQCHRALDRASALLDGIRPDGLVLGPSSVGELTPLVTGWCLYDLGRPALAAQVLDHSVPRIPGGAGRARARFGARRALAHAAAGEFDRACELAAPVLDEVERVDSATIRVELRRLARTLTRRRNHPRVRELQPRLAAALHAPIR